MVATVTKVTWNTSRLNAALTTGLRSSVSGAAKVAETLNPAKSRIHIVKTVNTARNVGIIRGTGPLAHLFEGGTQAHVIAPGGLKLERTSRRYSRSTGELTLNTSVRSKRGGKKAMFGKGLAHPISTPIQHPGMAAKPFIGPAGQAWPTIYRVETSRALARAGFGRR